MLTASPLNEDRVRVDEEFREIKERVDKIKSPKVRIEFDYKPAVRSADILSHLLNSDGSVFHFSGHACDKGLMFEDALGASISVDAQAIIDVLSKMKTSFKCAVLNACLTASMADSLALHLPYVIGCDATIADAAAVLFARAFYQSLSAGRSYRESFELAVADLKINGPKGEAEKYMIKGG